VPEVAFRQTRVKILREFLARRRIYSTGFFFERLEAPARANLQQSVSRLGAEPGADPSKGADRGPAGTTLSEVQP
jgi:hypothetical protein